MRNWCLTLVLAASVFQTGRFVAGPEEKRAHFTMRDQAGRHFTLVLGVDPKATDGFDPVFGEVPIPPPPPPGNFELRFLDRPGHPRVPGDGSYVDIRPLRSPTQVDTFIVHFQTANETYPVTFSWDRLRGCDSMFVVCRIGDVLRRIIMNSASSLSLNDEGESKLMIIRYGAR